MKPSPLRRTIRFRIRILTRPQDGVVGQFDPCARWTIEGSGKLNDLTGAYLVGRAFLEAD